VELGEVAQGDGVCDVDQVATALLALGEITAMVKEN